jgi:hypothetical protein
MPSLTKRTRIVLEAAWVAALCTLAILLTADHTRGDSITIDEPLHIYGGAEAVSHGVLFTNPEHPPLAKMLAALSLQRAHPNAPAIAPGAPLPPLPDVVAFLRENRVSYAEMLARARMPFRWLLAALIVVVYLSSRAISEGPGRVGREDYASRPARPGPTLIARDDRTIWPAVLASALIALDPNFVAHAGIVHTDVAGTLFITLAVVLTIAAVGGSAVRWLLVGLVLGLAIATKFTALILVPLVLLAPLLLLLEDKSRLAQNFAGALAACVVAAFVVYGVYAVNLRNMHPDDAALSSATFLRSRNADAATVARYAQLTRRAPEVGMFLSGVKGVQLSSETGRGENYLRGRVSREGFPHYFFVAFLVKSTPAMLLVTALIFAGGRGLRNRWSIGMLVVVITLFVVSIPSSFSIGIRHMLPVYPLLAIVGAGVIASRKLAAALIVSAAISLALIHPYELGYFNFIGGPEWLSDSNIDWGQDVDRMHAFLRERGWERDTTVIVFALPGLHDVERYRQFNGTLPPGRYATSAYMERVAMPGLFDALQTRGTRVAKIGASITIRELR